MPLIVLEQALEPIPTQRATKEKNKSPVSALERFNLLEPLHWKESWLKEKQSHFEFYSMVGKGRLTSGHVMVLYILYYLKIIFLLIDGIYFTFVK